MVRKFRKGKRFFYIQSANWEGVAQASSPKEACSLILREALDEFNNETEISPKILSVDLSSVGDTGEGKNFTLHPSCEILANIGKHGAASGIKNIVKNYE
tara:strand:- start:1378 stop:1677 length:300 start_codon:yes stop_codon:yes gene_type:complete